MAEAFGIAGSAFGTVSLGIQLFTEISRYLDSVEGRDGDLERAKNYARDFQSSLVALRTWASNTGFSDTDLERAISQGQANCAGAIKNLSATVAELKGQDPIPNSRTSKAKALYVKLKYPFKKQNVENLEKQLFNTISVLKFALLILQVKTSTSTQISIQGIEQTVLNILNRLPEPARDGNVAETAPEPAICLRDSTSNTPVSGLGATRYQNGTMWAINSVCICRKKYKRRERRQWGPFILENEISFADYHSPGCPLSTHKPLKQQTKGTLTFPIPFTRGRWRNASQFSLFFKAGTGGMGFGQNLAWVETVDRDQSPSFKISELAFIHRDSLNDEDYEVFLLSCYRRIKWCFANRRASITDVDQFGRSIVDYGTSGIILIWGKPCFPAEALQWFCMLSPFINPTTYQQSTTKYGDSAGQDCKSPFPWGGVRGQFDLVKRFPQISNYLEFGQLSRLILMEDQGRVEDFLRRYPSSMNEVNYLGQTPVHITVQTQNATILSVLVSHADPKLLNTKDNDGFYAIDHAIDALCHSLKPGKEPGSTVCNGCEVLNVLLRSESAIFTKSVRLAMQLPRYHTIPVCLEGQKNIIRSLASRRKELKTLAQRELTPAERQDLKFCEPGILDQNAVQTQQFLEANKCHVPIHLKVYDNDDSPKDSESIYLLICHGDVAESALQDGFLMPITLFDDVFRSLAQWLDSNHSHRRRWQDFLFSSYICWLVDHGGDLRSTVQTPWGRTTAAHYFMAYLSTNQNSFNIGCDGNETNAISPLSTADRLEIEEEDSSRLELLEKLVTEFERERGNYADLLSFAREYWAPRMETVYEEIESYVLTETQRQEAEEAGVVWECYGPQLAENEEETSSPQYLNSEKAPLILTPLSQRVQYRPDHPQQLGHFRTIRNSDTPTARNSGVFPRLLFKKRLFGDAPKFNSLRSECAQPSDIFALTKVAPL
ncbi:uncharacterized protein FTJAE_6956 [Fusarium tjaetaba]|uniref:Uncharacterized protein n=1 Tax=Fusarium tjaetaba TaxID=1567544 RepID=A0A8H5RDI7_9HYPO|nr:uncharacterized protein FTJAE_6956 [Fusarium tjaetaba]KAF5633805.1 hypothetical protein FTJAE_6956 [Fusarium tjaetaba]